MDDPVTKIIIGKEKAPPEPPLAQYQDDNKAELTLLAILRGKSAGFQRDKCNEIGVSWDEYLRLKRKWKRVLEREES